MSTGGPAPGTDDRALPEALRPRLEPAERAAHLRRALELYRTGRFYDAHDAWETVWRSTTPEPRHLIQALILVTVARHHLEDRNRPDVAARVLGKAADRLEGQAPGALGLDLGNLRSEVETWRRWCAAGASDPRPEELRIVVTDPGRYV